MPSIEQKESLPASLAQSNFSQLTPSAAPEVITPEQIKVAKIVGFDGSPIGREFDIGLPIIQVLGDLGPCCKYSGKHPSNLAWHSVEKLYQYAEQKLVTVFSQPYDVALPVERGSHRIVAWMSPSFLEKIKVQTVEAPFFEISVDGSPLWFAIGEEASIRSVLGSLANIAERNAADLLKSNLLTADNFKTLKDCATTGLALSRDPAQRYIFYTLLGATYLAEGRDSAFHLISCMVNSEFGGKKSDAFNHAN